MKRSLVTPTLALLALAAVAATALGNEPSGAGPGGFPHARGGHGLARLEKCLSTLDLSCAQQAAIPAILSSGRATLRGSAAALKADHQRLRADIANGADKSVLGQDVLDQEASRKKLHGDARAVRDQISAKLTPDQLTALRDCARPHRRGGRRWSSNAGE
jgi:Spy/CpxP family protein refolding chaperone